MRKLYVTTKFKKDLRKIRKRGKDTENPKKNQATNFSLFYWVKNTLSVQRQKHM